MHIQHVIPTDFALSRKEFREKFRRLIRIAHAIQIDFMDGKFVPVHSVAMREVPELRRHKSIAFEAHLMVANPREWIDAVAKKGFKKVIFHVEAVRSKAEAESVIEKAKNAGMQAMIALNAETPLSKITPYLRGVDGVLVMGIHAGKEHQKLSANTARRIAALKRKMPKLWVQIDGGVNPDNVARLAAAGADAVNSGSFVSAAEKPRGAMRVLERAFLRGKH